MTHHDRSIRARTGLPHPRPTDIREAINEVLDEIGIEDVRAYRAVRDGIKRACERHDRETNA